ncbi:MAG: deoxynucleoside kinase [Bacillota bacterium]
MWKKVKLLTRRIEILLCILYSTSEGKVLVLGRIICVSGNLGSGKTTLARGLAAELGWQVYPKRGIDETYITDLFSNPTRWSFEAQMAFLTHKAQSILDAMSKGFDIVLDRSIYEDVEVFARLFYQTGKMDERAYGTYRRYADLLLERMPVPVAVLYCACEPNVCEERLTTRPRVCQTLYPPGHLERLDNLYKEWLGGFRLCPIYGLNTVLSDVRLPETVRDVISSLRQFLAGQGGLNAIQMNLFSDLTVSNSLGPAILKPLNDVAPKATHLSSGPKRGTTSPDRPQVYIAAPFTGVADPPEPLSGENGQQLLTLAPPEHGVIHRGRYRSILVSIASEFKRLGYNPLLPHRDINHWGHKRLTPDEVGRQCVQAVQESDLFFGVLGASYGAHVEAGMAVAMGKPCILVGLESEEMTFMSRALTESGLAVQMVVPDWGHIASGVRSAQFRNLLDRAVTTAALNRSRYSLWR